MNRRQQAYLNKLCLAVIIPCYNEDPVLLSRCISALISQSRKPNEIVLVDDGSTNSNYKDVYKYAKAKAKRAGIKLTWKRTANFGKRHAQSVGINLTPNADIYLTVDSDGILDRKAIKEGMKPFVDPKVKSVAGVVMAINNRKNILTRFIDLWFLTGQLIDRSSFSVVGSVLVNSGVLAFYDANMLRKYLDSYCNEIFFGVHVELSDDSMLTMYAIAEGRAVQQTTSFAFTAMPETINHHVRQYIRWMRGAFIRTWWRFKYLPLNGYAYWSHFLGWVQVLITTVIFVAFFIINPAVQRQVVPYFILIPIVVGYGQGLRYLTIKRSDESFRSQLFTFSLAIITTFWSFFVLRVVRWYSILTCRRGGWATREKVEVKIA
ncbi:MAG: glycosyltransferase [Candidatus Saccharimonadales bacterium]